MTPRARDHLARLGVTVELALLVFAGAALLGWLGVLP
jgi:hypothetical protein